MFKKSLPHKQALLIFIRNNINTNSRSTYRQTLDYNKFILRQAPLSGVFSPVGGGVGIMPTEGLTDRPACLRSLSKVNAVT